MTVKIIDDACVFAGQESTIIVSGDSIDDVASTEAKHMALQKAAALGMSKPGISDQSGCYPVDTEGILSNPSKGNVLPAGVTISGSSRGFDVRVWWRTQPVFVHVRCANTGIFQDRTE